MYVDGLPWWLSSEESACNAGVAGDAGSIPGSRRSSGGRRVNPLQDSCLENALDGGAWQATVHRVAKSWTQLKQISTHVCMCMGFTGGSVVENLPIQILCSLFLTGQLFFVFVFNMRFMSYISWILTPYQIYHLQIFSPSQ